MNAAFVRDAAMTAAIFGFFASSWFGWAQENPPPGWRIPLAVASVASLLIAAAGGFLAWQNWNDGTVFTPTTARRFGLVVGIEVALCGAGAGVLAVTGKTRFIPVWIALVVGVHFFPLAPLLLYPLLYVTAALVSVGALAALLLAHARGVTVSAVVGALVGVILLASALVSLVIVLT